MRPRTLDVIEHKKTNRASPGPGTYAEIDLNPKTGRFSFSNYLDTKFAKINPNTERFEKVKETPGPLNYA